MALALRLDDSIPDVVAIVSSAGGTAALGCIVRGLPADFAAPIVVVQHRSAEAPERLPNVMSTAGRQGRRTFHPTRSVRDGDYLYRPGVAVVPGGNAVDIDAAGRMWLRPTRTIDRPGDHVLEQLAEARGPRLLAVILTGTLQDGARGIRAVKALGGRVIVEDPASATYPGMPQAAIATGCFDFVLRLEQVAAAITALTLAPGGASLLQLGTPSFLHS